MPRKGAGSKRVPMAAATGGTYGSGVAQIRAQQQVPMATPAPAAPAPAQPAAGAPGGGLAAVSGPPPGSLTPLDAPSARPDQPVTAGLPVGPGAGPDVLGLRSERDVNLADIAPYLPALEVMANQPNATVAARNLVRRLRGSLPAHPNPGAVSGLGPGQQAQAQGQMPGQTPGQTPRPVA